MRVTLALLTLFMTTALAADAAPRKAPPRPIPLLPEAAATAPTPSLESVCTLGITGPAAFSIEYIVPPDDAYYLRVRPTRCAGCPDSAGVWVSYIQLTLDFPLLCTMPVEIALVHAKGDSACAPPDPSHLIIGPVATQMVPSGTGIQSFSLALGQSVPIGRDVFLRLAFTGEGLGCAGDGNRPRLVTTASCTLCVAYNYYPSDSADLCALLLPGLPLISAPGDLCVTPAQAGVEGASPAELKLRLSPNPMADDARIELALARETSVRIEVCDLAGRSVRTLFSGVLPAGVRAWAWDGRDETGTRVRAGVYFVRVRSASGEVARALTRLR